MRFLGPDFSPLTEPAPVVPGPRGCAGAEHRRRLRLVLLLAAFHRRRLPAGAAGSLQPQAARRRAAASTAATATPRSRNSPVANVPPTQACMNCHQLVMRDSAKLAPIRDSAASGQPMRWVRVHKLPDYAYFNHRAHISAGVGCVSCHGRIDEMEVVHQEQPLSMSWCLDCHRNPAPNLRPLSEITNMTWRPARDAKAARTARSRHCDLSIRRQTARGATDEFGFVHDARILAQPRRACRQRRVARVPRARVPGGRVGSARRADAAARPSRSWARRFRSPAWPPAGAPTEHIVPYVNAPEQVIPGVPRHYATTMPLGHQRLRPRGREPRGPADQDRRQRAASRDTRLVERPHPGRGPRPLRPRPVAVRHEQGRGHQLGRRSWPPGRCGRRRTPTTAAHRSRCCCRPSRRRPCSAASTPSARRSRRRWWWWPVR